jgi:hypothetical protein
MSSHTLIELAILAALYYIGRSIGQAAIVFGVAREADNRTVSLTRQIGVGINTFGRRLTLDLMFAIIQLLLIGAAIGLIIVGGEDWPVNAELQVAAIFMAFMVILYLSTAAAISRGLASVALTLTNERTTEAAKLGWRLFSHRFELLGLRFMAVTMELILALPLAVLAAAFILRAPSEYHALVTAGVAALAFIAGALFGAGTATWWSSLYRRVVLTDHSDKHAEYLAGIKPHEPATGALTFIVSLASFLVAAAIALPWLKF